MRKLRRLSVFLASALAMSMLAGNVAMAAEHGFSIDMIEDNDEAWENIAMVNDDTVETGAAIRVSADPDAEAAGFLYRGGAVKVIHKGDEWTEVESGDVTGFVMNDYLIYGTEAKGLAEHYGQYGVRARWDDASVFAGPTADSRVVTQVKEGDTLWFIGNYDDHWIQVKAGDGTLAYVSEEDMQLIIAVDTAYHIDEETDESKSVFVALPAGDEPYEEPEDISEEEEAAEEEEQAQEEYDDSSYTQDTASADTSYTEQQTQTTTQTATQQTEAAQTQQTEAPAAQQTEAAQTEAPATQQTEAAQTEAPATQQTEAAQTEAAQTADTTSSDDGEEEYDDDEDYEDDDSDDTTDDSTDYDTATYDEEDDGVDEVYEEEEVAEEDSTTSGTQSSETTASVSVPTSLAITSGSADELQAQANTLYETYLTAQAAADAAVANGSGEQAINDTAATAQAAYAIFLKAQNLADEAQWGTAEAASAAQDTSSADQDTSSADEETYEEEDAAADYAEETYEEEASAETEAAQTTTSQASASDLDLLAALIYCEAGNQPYEGQVAVGAVVMNRVSSGSFPGSISEVIYQSGQFTPAYSGALASALANGSGSGYTGAASEAMAGSDPTGGALYFNVHQGSGTKIGDHWFF